GMQRVGTLPVVVDILVGENPQPWSAVVLDGVAGDPLGKLQPPYEGRLPQFANELLLIGLWDTNRSRTQTAKPGRRLLGGFKARHSVLEQDHSRGIDEDCRVERPPFAGLTLQAAAEEPVAIL